MVKTYNLKHQFQCYIKIVPHNVTAIIRGGEYRMIHKDYNAIFNGELSVDHNCELGSKNCIIDYVWTCEGIAFCNNFKSNESKFIIPKEELQKYVNMYL